MKIEIWSDIMCPFCYIGKRRFEEALSKFPEKSEVEVEWKSFQLMPELETEPGKSLDQFLADEKGMSLDQARQMNARVLQMGAEVSLNFNFEKATPANTFKAHKLLHFAKDQGKQDAAAERLFQAYFTEGKNVDDLPTLLNLGEEIGLQKEALKEALESRDLDQQVQTDIYEASQIGIGGVPFFLFNQKYAVSGAQGPEVFEQALKQSFSEWKAGRTSGDVTTAQGEVCEPGGD